jgi:hypothetical protein
MIDPARTGQRIDERHSFCAGMATTEEGIFATNADVAVDSFDGIVVRVIIVLEDIIA